MAGKTLMQVSDHYFTTQVYIFNCLTIKRTAFLLPLEIPFSEWACDVTPVKKRSECSIGEIILLAKLAYSTISKADLLLKLILRYVINVFLASCQVSLL